MRLAAWLAPVLTAAAMLPQGQFVSVNPAPTRGTGLVVGQVVDGITGRPVGGVLVTANINVMAPARGAAPPAGGAPPSAAAPAAANAPVGVQASTTQRVLSDGDGRFLFHDLPKSTISISATAPGYTAGLYGQRRPNGPSRSIDLADGQRVGDAVVRVWKVAVISGTVVDEVGDPLISVQVQAMRSSILNGQRRFTTVNQSTTDDRGMYHFSLPMGDYVIAVPSTTTSVPASSIDLYQQAISTPGTAGTDFMRDLSSSNAPIPSGSGYRIGAMQVQQSGALSRAMPAPGEGRLMTYQTTFYPSATVLSQAQVITLGAGDERPAVDLSLRLVGTSHVSGIVTGSEGAVGNLGVRLTLADSADSSPLDTQFPAANSLTESSGAFTLLGVPPGQYVLRITKIPRAAFEGAGPIDTTATPTLWAQMPVVVNDTDVNGLVVALHAGVKLSGRVEFDGSAVRPTPQRLQALTLTAQDLEGRSSIPPTRFTADGTFATLGLLPGRYLLSASSPGQPWTLKSILLNGRDLSATPASFESDAPGIIVTYTDHPTELEVTVHTDATATNTDAPPAVVLFPANYQAWLAGGTAGRLSRFTQVQPNAPVTLRSLPAGDYFIAAVSSDLQSDWQDAKTLEAIARVASHVNIGDGEHRSVELRPQVIK